MAMTYAEQLKHPNWQRRRLECLEAGKWRCAVCWDQETTLHVHHKRYVKGRLAWEYADDELEVLCEVCHEVAHELRSELALLIDSSSLERVAALVAGYLNRERGDVGERTWAIGRLAGKLDTPWFYAHRDKLDAIVATIDREIEAAWKEDEGG